MPKDDDAFEVFPENWPAFEVFVACSTQWMGIGDNISGLNYPSVYTVMRIYRVKNQRDTIERIRTMEYSAMLEFAKRKSK